MATIKPSKDGRIFYVPTQVDPLSIASKRALQQSPVRLFFRDLLVLLKLLPYLPQLFLPYRTKDDKGECCPSAAHKKETVLQGILSVLEIILLLLLLPAMLVLPGIICLLLVAVTVLLVKLLAWPLEGRRVIYSQANETTTKTAHQHKSERWIFINGCASGHGSLQRDIDRLSQVFGRQIMGIHNMTYGLPADIMECLIQRVFSYTTTDVRVAYEQIKVVLLDPWVSKVVLIGHSQGGIVISLVLDQLFTELPSSIMSKIEVYTFGSAASHFSNPPITSIPVTDFGKHPRGSNGIIPCIEHYANEYDMVPRWGVLYSTQSILSTRYSGAVFVHMGASGHMFVQHYLDAMFPYLEPERRRLAKNTQLMESFLDRVVNVDEATVARRETLVMEELDLMNSGSGLDLGNGERMGYGSRDGSGVLTFSRTPTGRLIADEAKGKTVRQLSRLWKYQGGRSPDDDLVNAPSGGGSPS